MEQDPVQLLGRHHIDLQHAGEPAAIEIIDAVLAEYSGIVHDHQLRTVTNRSEQGRCVQLRPPGLGHVDAHLDRTR